MVRETLQESAVSSRANTEGSAGLSGGASVERRRAEGRSRRKGVTVEVGVAVSKESVPGGGEVMYAGRCVRRWERWKRVEEHDGGGSGRRELSMGVRGERRSQPWEKE